jgi:DNA-binding transcriptional ArsR family regulator
MSRVRRETTRREILERGNYYPLRKDFIKVLGLRGTAAILFTVIYSYSLNDELQGLYYGTRKQLAEEVGVSISSCTKYLKQLVDENLVEKNLVYRDGQWTPTYRVNPEKIERLIDEEIEKKYSCIH